MIADPPTPGLELGAQPQPPPPDARPRPEEVRFALVLYGGVSLAIYIYGVIYEFWRLVRASQHVEENAYSKLLDDVGTTATVDIVSGASAGGINGILLAKALATGADLEAVRSIWEDRADFDELLRPRSERHPRSLLRTELFEQLLAEGLADMDASAPEKGGALVRAFDLFASGTRLRPWIRDFPTDLRRSIKTADYHKSFRLQLRRQGYNPQDTELGYDRSDFASENNDTLVAVARATSAFPAAFEPRLMRRDDAKELYRTDEPDASYFSDGGILENKPFTEAVNTIVGRAADRPVTRWLVSVEPDPEHFAQLSNAEPEVDEVVSKAVFGIPRYQSIAADLERVEAHRARAVREGVLLDALDARVATLPSGWSTQVEEAPILGAYLTARRLQLYDDLAQAIADAGGLDETTKVAVRAGLNAAVQLSEGQAELPDVSFERRRIYHLITRASRRLGEGTQQPTDETRVQLQCLWAEFDRLGAAIWETVNRGPLAESLQGLRDLREVEISTRIIELVPALHEALAAILPRADSETLAACTQLDALMPQPPTSNAPSLTTVYAGYWLWDQFLLPVDPRVGVPARDRIMLARASPRDAQHISVPAAQKVAGDAVFHFGGFLKKEWRANDILWGRLDAAETIVRMLLKPGEAPPAEVDAHIEAVQSEVIERELPEALPNYRRHLELKYKVGSETLKDVPMQVRTSLVVRSADVLRNMLGGLASDPADKVAGIYRWVGRAIGGLLIILRWPVMAIWGDDPLVRRAISLAVAFIGAWAAVTLGLYLFGVIEEVDRTLWTLLAIAGAIFVVWTLLLAAVSRRSAAPSRADPGNARRGPRDAGG